MGVHSLNGRVIRLSLSPILYPVALCETQNECHHALERGHIVREFTCSRLPRHSHFCVESIECKKIDKNRKKKHRKIDFWKCCKNQPGEVVLFQFVLVFEMACARPLMLRHMTNRTPPFRCSLCVLHVSICRKHRGTPDF